MSRNNGWRQGSRYLLTLSKVIGHNYVPLHHAGAYRNPLRGYEQPVQQRLQSCKKPSPLTEEGWVGVIHFQQIHKII